jgi:hypothetical protein
LDFGWSVGDCDDDAADYDVAAERARPGRAAPTDRSSGRVAETANVEASSDRQCERDPLNNSGASSGPRIYYQNDDPGSMIWTKRKVWTMISIFDRSLFPHGIIYYA